MSSSQSCFRDISDVLRAAPFNPKNKDRRLHRHAAFFGTMQECLEDCCEVWPCFVDSSHILICLTVLSETEGRRGARGGARRASLRGPRRTRGRRWSRSCCLRTPSRARCGGGAGRTGVGVLVAPRDGVLRSCTATHESARPRMGGRMLHVPPDVIGRRAPRTAKPHPL